MKSALLISTYNWPEALELVFQSILAQKHFPDELLIADDGSSGTTKKLINEFQLQCPIPLKHIWHEDLGFRKAAILNKTIAQTSADYIIQVDGDCILHPYFVKDHLQASGQGHFLFGSRVNLREEFLPTLFQQRIYKFHFLSQGIRNRTRNLRIPFFGKLYVARRTFSKKFRGCNTSYFRKDFIAVNGYNEAFEGWGREDSDLALRLLNLGLRMKRLRYRGILYHIHHKIKSKAQLEYNDAIEKNTIKNKLVRCEKGIDQYL
ncbi:MAG TPA: glycosyltransferase family 2 protein [Flavobacteriaceae bacterium]|nr:glycosyltransferase family 2 protein [Flavobacteriaceae bacterium]MCB9212397.1 glycosyltransferase family 2 protein [Alteromonas sp.]HPF11673.1 glycosyltransferase family 2 protein [Flavobacteriaceae bacterium]HQU20148.1 glycosyltransferase family 2 protein [Flavobacteriaceae bacterium]HQU64763.1 glycosyltransferase family 2 protein [Flavobacteriaceae bacterium]